MLERLLNPLKHLAAAITDKVVAFFGGREALTDAYFSWNVVTAGLFDRYKTQAARIKAFFVSHK